MVTISYVKLWNKLSDNKMRKADFARAAGLSAYMMTKLSQNRVVPMSIMLRCCTIFHCDIGDLMEVTEQED